MRVLVIGLSLLMVAWGALTLASLLGRGSGEDSGSYDGVSSIVLDTAFESIEVVGSPDATTVSMDRTYHWSFSEPKVGARQDGDVLRLSSSCTFQVAIGCTGRVHLVVPADVELRLQSSDGSMTLRDLTGPVDVVTSDGRLTASNLSGRVTMRTSDGSVNATGLRSENVEAVTSDGSVRLEFAVAPTSVTGRTGDGSIDVIVPRDGTAYDVNATTGDGGRDVSVPTDPRSAKHIELKTGDGSIEVTDR
jgi:hypothetical protein